MTDRDSRAPTPANAEAMLGTLARAVDAMTVREAGMPTHGQVARQFEVLAAEVRSDAPLPDLARAAGTGLIEVSGRWSDLRPAVSSSVGDLLRWVDRRAAPGQGQATGAVASTSTSMPETSERLNPPIVAPQAGAPILPDDERRGR